MKGVPHHKRCAHWGNRNLEKRKRQSLAALGRRCSHWKGGRILQPSGYVKVYLEPNDFFFPMVGSIHYHYVFEHRLVMAKHLNRCLLPWEVVHHINGVKNDNRVDNLELVNGAYNHICFTLLQKENRKLMERIGGLEARITLLEAELVLTKTQSVSETEVRLKCEKDT